MRATRAPIDDAWLEEQVDALERLVEEGDTLELVARLRSLASAQQRSEQAAPERARSRLTE